MAQISLGNGMIAIVDDADFPLVKGMSWTAHKNKNVWYARHGRISMHRLIVDAKPREMWDHENGDGLDNRRENLRPTNYQANKANQHHGLHRKTSRYIGVSKKRHKFRVSMKINGKNTHCGVFSDEVDAARHYDRMATKLHGDSAITNFQ